MSETLDLPVLSSICFLGPSPGQWVQSLVALEADPTTGGPAFSTFPPSPAPASCRAPVLHLLCACLFAQTPPPWFCWTVPHPGAWSPTPPVALLTCSPARCPAAIPWWTAPAAPTGPRSLVDPSADGSHTTAAGAWEWLWGLGSQSTLGVGKGQAWLRPRPEQVAGASYHLNPDVSGECLLSLVLGVQEGGLRPQRLSPPP